MFNIIRLRRSPPPLKAPRTAENLSTTKLLKMVSKTYFKHKLKGFDSYSVSLWNIQFCCILFPLSSKFFGSSKDQGSLKNREDINVGAYLAVGWLTYRSWLAKFLLQSFLLRSCNATALCTRPSIRENGAKPTHFTKAPLFKPQKWKWPSILVSGWIDMQHHSSAKVIQFYHNMLEGRVEGGSFTFLIFDW